MRRNHECDEKFRLNSSIPQYPIFVGLQQSSRQSQVPHFSRLLPPLDSRCASPTTHADNGTANDATNSNLRPRRYLKCGCEMFTLPHFLSETFQYFLEQSLQPPVSNLRIHSPFRATAHSAQRAPSFSPKTTSWDTARPQSRPAVAEATETFRRPPSRIRVVGASTFPNRNALHAQSPMLRAFARQPLGLPSSPLGILSHGAKNSAVEVFRKHGIDVGEACSVTLIGQKMQKSPYPSTKSKKTVEKKRSPSFLIAPGLAGPESGSARGEANGLGILEVYEMLAPENP